jgi:fructokinase
VTIGVLGESLVDVLADTAAGTVERPGGSPFNVALTLARLDIRCRLFTAVGDDSRGDSLLAALSAEGVDVTLGATTSTAIARATLDGSGRATYEIDLAWDPRFSDDWPPLDVLHFSSLGAVVQPGADEVRRVADRYRGNALISYDPNWRDGFVAVDAARETFEANASRADVVKLSHDDAAAIYPNADLDEVAAAVLSLGPAFVVITKGEQGAAGWTANARKQVAAAPAEVVDTIGAGDAFMATVLSELAEMDRATVAALNSREIELVLSFAAFVAGKTCERAGADPPRIGDLF